MIGSPQKQQAGVAIGVIGVTNRFRGGAAVVAGTQQSAFVDMATRLLFILVIALVALATTGADAAGWSETASGWWKKAKEKAKDATKLAHAVAVDYGLVGEPCPFVDDVVHAVNASLRARIIAQDGALAHIVEAFEGWDFLRHAGASPGGGGHGGGHDHHTGPPLVIALTGPTGVGKTESANTIAEAVLKRRKRLSRGSARTVPCGLLTFQGADFGDAVARPITRYHDEIKRRLVRHLTQECGGSGAVVLFDEVQKVIPHTLDVLMEALDPERPRLTYFDHTAEGDGEEVSVDTSRVVFLFVSDIGSKATLRTMLGYATRGAVPYARINQEVRLAYDEQWRRLEFGKAIEKVVPFLPLEPADVQEVIRRKLRKLDADMRAAGGWRAMRFSGDVAAYMASPATGIIVYERFKSPQAKGPGDGGAGGGGGGGEGGGAAAATATKRQLNQQRQRFKGKTYSKYGARTAQGPVNTLKGKLLRYIPRPYNGTSLVKLGVVRGRKGGFKDAKLLVHHCALLHRDAGAIAATARIEVGAGGEASGGGAAAAGDATPGGPPAALQQRCDAGDDCSVMELAEFTRLLDAERAARTAEIGDRVCASVKNCLVDWAGDDVYYYSCREIWSGKV